jgi:arylsulfatase A-like enzyme
MNVVFILLDSLNRMALGCYGGSAVQTPGIDRLAAQGVVFDNHYVGSLPCMPARRDLLTGRLNFLHRSWGPVEPFDQCFTQALSAAGVYTHLISDHYHYWEIGGAGYHNQYASAEFVRGQERDLWKAMVQPPVDRFRETYHPMLSAVERRFPNMVNREYIQDEADFPVVRCTELACEFLETNRNADNWFLQLELFDPHEPFVCPE